MKLSLPQMIGDASALQAAVLAALAGTTPTAGTISAAIDKAAEEAIAATLAAQLHTELADILASQEVAAGPRTGNGTDPEDWESQVDDAVMALLESDYQDVLGAGYCGGASVDTRLHEPDRPEELAREIATAYAKEVVKRDRETIATFVDVRPGAPAPEADAGPARATLVVVLATYIRDAQTVGLYDIMTLLEDLDLASDSEEALAVGALQRIAPKFVNPTEIRNALVLVRKTGGAGWDSALIDEAEKAAASAEPVAEKPKKTRRTKAQKTAEAAPPAPPVTTPEPEGDGLTDEERALIYGDAPVSKPLLTTADAAGHKLDLSPGAVNYVGDAPPAHAHEITPEIAKEALILAKEHLAISEKDLAERMGFSRATLNNICAGKSKLHMKTEQRDALLTLTLAASNGLLAITQALTGRS